MRWGSFLALGVSAISLLFGSFVGLGGVSSVGLKGMKITMFPKLFFVKLTLSPPSTSSSLVDFINYKINITIPEGLFSNEYDIYLWSFCTHTKVSSTCTLPKSQLLELVQVWHPGDQQLPSILESPLETYKNVAGYVGPLYVGALACTLISLVVGTCSMVVRRFPKTPLFPFLLSFIACMILLIASIFTTITFVTLVGGFQAVFRGSGVKAVLGRDAFILLWITFGSSFLAASLWFSSLVVHICFG